MSRFFDDLWHKLEDILGGPRLDNAMSGPTNSTLIRKQARADAPKLEMAGDTGQNVSDRVAPKNGRFTKKGAKREPANRYWEKSKDRADMSEANKDLIEKKRSPKVDDDWIKQHPEDKKLL